jgi:ATPase subunit of ABC transporter with duplicated ATPase domains
MPTEVLVLDEPTNNLDLANIEFLENLLRSYQGAIIISSHDEWFLKKLGATRELQLCPNEFP